MRCLLLLVVILASAADPTVAAVFRVPEDGTLLEAGDLTASGDTIFVAPGDYTETDTRIIVVTDFPRPVTSCLFLKRGVSLIGAGKDQTEIRVGQVVPDMPNSAVVVVTGNGEDENVISDLSLRGGNEANGLEAVYVRSLVLERVCFSECIFAVSLSEVTTRMQDCVVEECGGSRGAVSILESEAELIGCEFRRNRERAVFVDQTDGYETIRFESCSFVENVGSDRGIAVLLAPSPLYFEFKDCRFERNRSEEYDYAVVRAGDSEGKFIECVFADNETTPVRLIRSKVWFRNNTFWRNRATWWHGSAIAVAWGRVRLLNNIFAGSRGQEALYLNDEVTVNTTSGCNLFWDNEGGHSIGWPTIDTDMVVDPGFCDATSGDLTVAKNSPCVTQSSCPQIGKFGVGCDPITVDESSWGQVKSWYRPGARSSQ